jgi:hypothetical protein
LDFYPIGFALNGLPPDVPRWGTTEQSQQVTRRCASVRARNLKMK